MVTVIHGLRQFADYQDGSLGVAEAACHAVVEWLAKYITGPHPHGGGRHVCPALPESIARKALWIGPIDSDVSSKRAVDDLIAWEQRFFEIPPYDLVNASFKALVLVLRPDSDRRRVQNLKNAASMHFLRSGLIVGSFNPEERGVRYKPEKNWPPRSPVPVWTVRHLIASDLRFVASNPAKLAEYERRFGRSGTQTVPRI